MITLLPNISTVQDCFITPKSGVISYYKLFLNNVEVFTYSMPYVVYSNYTKVGVNYAMEPNQLYTLRVYDASNNELWSGLVNTWQSGKILQNEFITL
jgi:hypothetical protein